MVKRESPKDLGEDDPICPVCLQPIRASDKVRGLADDLMHEGCDYTRPERPPGPATKPPRVGVKESQEPQQQPVCPVCGRQFEPGEGRYRVGFTSIHVDCYEKFKKTALPPIRASS